MILKLRQELKERDEKILSQGLELTNQGETILKQNEKILSQERELKERDEIISSQKQVSQTIRSSLLAVPKPIEPAFTVSAHIVQDGFEGGEVRPSSAPLFANTKESGRSELNTQKTNCFSMVPSRCVTM